MKIDRIIVMCWKRDFHLARPCLTSIRYFYPDIPLHLIKDTGAGDFDTSELEERLRVETQSLSAPYGSAFGKLAPLLDPTLGRFLFVDADQLMIGPVLEALERCEADFVVAEDHPPSDEKRIAELYYDIGAVNRLDPAFKAPGYFFNSGQFVANAGKMKRADFEEILPWTLPLRLRHRIFSLNDQGVLNYVVPKLQQAGRLTVGFAEFSELARTPYFWNVTVEEIRLRKARPTLVHWAGQTRTFFGLMRRGDLWTFFEKEYYRGIPGGSWVRARRTLERAPRNAWQYAYQHAGKLKRRFGKSTSSQSSFA